MMYCFYHGQKIICLDSNIRRPSLRRRRGGILERRRLEDQLDLFLERVGDRERRERGERVSVVPLRCTQLIEAARGLFWDRLRAEDVDVHRLSVDGHLARVDEL